MSEPLTPEELAAIDFACMVLLEHARRGRQKQKDSILAKLAEVKQ